MDMLAIFGLQIFLSVCACSLLAKWFLAPWLKEKTQREGLFWLTLPHATRHVGMVFLVPGVVSPSLPQGFAVAAAYGDLAAGVLALLVLIALRSGWEFARSGRGSGLELRRPGRCTLSLYRCRG